MTSNINALPPPFPNQALAQAREAGQIPADTNKSASKDKDSESVVAAGTRPPAVDTDDSTNKQSSSQGQASNEDANFGHVNIEA